MWWKALPTGNLVNLVGIIFCAVADQARQAVWRSIAADLGEGKVRGRILAFMVMMFGTLPVQLAPSWVLRQCQWGCIAINPL